MTYPPTGETPQPEQPGQSNPHPGYQQPQPGYGTPPPGYQQPQPGYQQPQPGYGTPPPGYQQGYQQPQPGYGPPPGTPDVQQAALAHLLGGIFSWLGALIMWLVSKDKSAFNDAEGKKALNFQIWVVIGYIALGIVFGVLTSIASASGSLGFYGFIGFLSWLVPTALWVVSLVFGIKNFNAVKNGSPSSYPITVGLIK